MTTIEDGSPDGHPDSVEPVNPKELGAFLRAHRERVTPQSRGLPQTPRRRTKGLRREEVAALSGVGLAWYTWLEQGRVVPSKKVLDAVARTLGLDSASHRHLLALAGLLPPPVEGAGRAELAARLAPMLDGWSTSPAVLLDGRFDLVAWNDAYVAVWPDPALIDPVRRNLMWCLAGGTERHRGLDDWEPLARAVLAQFRAQTARRPNDPRTRELYRVLREDYPHLEPWWECQGIDDLTARDIRVRTRVGALGLRITAFRPVDDPEALVLVQSPATECDRQLMTELLTGGVGTADVTGAGRRLQAV
jgi:transcriptional regulator with XRE-family HTH domain